MTKRTLDVRNFPAGAFLLYHLDLHDLSFAWAVGSILAVVAVAVAGTGFCCVAGIGSWACCTDCY